MLELESGYNYEGYIVCYIVEAFLLILHSCIIKLS